MPFELEHHRFASGFVLVLSSWVTTSPYYRDPIQNFDLGRDRKIQKHNLKAPQAEAATFMETRIQIGTHCQGTCDSSSYTAWKRLTWLDPTQSKAIHSPMIPTRKRVWISSSSLAFCIRCSALTAKVKDSLHSPAGPPTDSQHIRTVQHDGRFGFSVHLFVMWCSNRDLLMTLAHLSYWAGPPFRPVFAHLLCPIVLVPTAVLARSRSVGILLKTLNLPFFPPLVSGNSEHQRRWLRPLGRLLSFLGWGERGDRLEFVFFSWIRRRFLALLTRE